MSYEPPAHGFRTFVIVWFMQSISVFGSALTLFAVSIWLAQVLYPDPSQKSQLALAVSAISLAHALPMIIAMPFAGAWADRHDRKTTMMVMDFLNGCLSALLLLLILSDTQRLWAVFAVVSVASLASTFHVLAFDTSYAMLVSEKQLPGANGMMQAMSELSGIIAPALAAVIISLPVLARQGSISGSLGAALARLSNGMPLAIGIDAVTFFLAAATLIFLFIPSPKRLELAAGGPKPRASVWADAKVGLRFIIVRRSLLWLLIAFSLANLLGTPLLVFQPLLAKFNLAADWAAHNFRFETALAAMNSFASLGGVVGGVTVSIWGGLKTRRIHGVLVPMAVAAVAEIVLGLSSWFYLSVAMLFVVGVTITVMNAHAQSIWQTQTPREMQGRVFAVRRLISRITWPLGIMMAGWIAGILNAGTVLAVLGSIFLVVTILQFFNRTLLRVEDTSLQAVD